MQGETFVRSTLSRSIELDTNIVERSIRMPPAWAGNAEA
jgi:hypothetical protein